jgi:hypothetical protein
VIVELVIASSLVAAAIGAVASRRAGTRAAPSDAPSERAPSGPLDDESPLGLDDVLLLDGGRGPELCITGAAVFAERDAAPSLRLYAATANVGAPLRLLAHDPREPLAIGLFTPVAAGRGDRSPPSPPSPHSPPSPPSTLEAQSEAGRALVRLEARRIGRLARVGPPRAAADPLPAEGSATLIAQYRGERDALALWIRTDDRRLLRFDGVRVALSQCSILRVAANPEAAAPR